MNKFCFHRPKILHINIAFSQFFAHTIAFVWNVVQRSKKLCIIIIVFVSEAWKKISSILSSRFTAFQWWENGRKSQRYDSFQCTIRFIWHYNINLYVLMYGFNVIVFTYLNIVNWLFFLIIRETHSQKRKINVTKIIF